MKKSSKTQKTSMANSVHRSRDIDTYIVHNIQKIPA